MREAIRFPSVHLPKFGSSKERAPASDQVQITTSEAQDRTRKGLIETIKTNKPRALEIFIMGLSGWYALSAADSFARGDGELGAKQLIDAVALTVVAGLIYGGEKAVARLRRKSSSQEAGPRSNQQ